MLHGTSLSMLTEQNVLTNSRQTEINVKILSKSMRFYGDFNCERL